MKPNIGISDDNLKSVIETLNKVLANANVIYIKLRKFHWNVAGHDFLEFHELFQEQYTIVEGAVDEIAERVSTLGGIAIGTTSEFAKLSELKETPGKNPDPEGMVKELLNDHETIVRGLRTAIDDCEDKFEDKGTADFLTGLIQAHEKMAWKLRQYLK